MIKPLNIEQLNRVAPYWVEETDDVGFYQFQTDEGVLYSIGFLEDFALSSSDSFQLIVANLNNRRSHRDAKVRKTVIAIVDEFFHCNNTTLLYLCETGDNKQRLRSRLFEYWFSTYNQKALFTTLSSVNISSSPDSVSKIIERPAVALCSSVKSQLAKVAIENAIIMD